MMKKTLLLLWEVLFLPEVFAQNKIGYGYDGAGNRIKREIIMQTPQAMITPNMLDSDIQMCSEIFQGCSVKIYPNPTDGELKVCILGFKESDRCFMGLYTAQGRLIMATKGGQERI